MNQVDDIGKISILLAEDDPNLRMLIQDYLELMEFKVYAAEEGLNAVELFATHDIDICILDIMMPKLDGFSVAGEIRKLNPAVPIVFLTAKALKEDRIKGFNAGCDDYITKPFSTDELNLRLKAILRRCNKKPASAGMNQNKIYQIGDFTFDLKEMILKIGSDEVLLTRKEASILNLLCEHRNKTLTRETAHKVIWGDSDYFVGRSMDVFISRLRKYLKKDPKVSITNVHGLGFTLQVNSQDESAE